MQSSASVGHGVAVGSGRHSFTPSEPRNLFGCQCEYSHWRPSARTKKQTAAPRKAPVSRPARAALVGRYLEVPTSFFNVVVEGARYLARFKAPHKDKKDMLVAYPLRPLFL